MMTTNDHQQQKQSLFCIDNLRNETEWVFSDKSKPTAYSPTYERRATGCMKWRRLCSPVGSNVGIATVFTAPKDSTYALCWAHTIDSER